MTNSASGAAFGLAEPIADILKTVHWNLGEVEYPIFDWKGCE